MSEQSAEDRKRHLGDLMHSSWGSNVGGTTQSISSNWRLSATGSNGGVVWTPDSPGTVTLFSPLASVSAAPVSGTDVRVNRADHDHGDNVGPPTTDLAITYSAPGVPTVVTRTDSGLISTATISYAGTHITSVVTTKLGKTFTVTPTYTGNDITAVHRTVT